ncbi:MAG: hypothetical protein ACO1SX_25715 [Actinomycetota bacterium]
MLQLNWSNGEKKAARAAFDRARDREHAALLAEVRARLERITDPHEIWRLHDYLTAQRRQVDDKYDFRYSQLISVFARLLGEGWLEEDDLEGLSEDKIAPILALGTLTKAPSRRRPG